MEENKKIDQKLCAKLDKRLKKIKKRLEKLRKKEKNLSVKIGNLIVKKDILSDELNAAKGIKKKTKSTVEYRNYYYNPNYYNPNKPKSDSDIYDNLPDGVVTDPDGVIVCPPRDDIDLNAILRDVDY